MEFTLIFNSGLSFEDTISLNINAASKEEALENALTENPELSGWNYMIK